MLTIDQLFTPKISGVTSDPNAVPADGTWLASLLETAAALGLPTTSWQPGAPERTILAIAAVAFAQEDVLVSLMAQGGFLDFAASGTVSTVALNGETVTVPVTPDPSIAAENPTGAPGWLDALGQSFFDVERLQATAAGGLLAIANTSNSVLSFAAGLYHVANENTGALYSNTASLVVPPNASGVGGGITAVASGSPITTVTTASNHGRSVGDVVFFEGVNGITGINGAFAVVTAVPTSSSMQVSLVTSGSWTSGGTVYKTTVAPFAADAVGLGGNAAPGEVTVTVAATPGVSVDNLTAWSASNYESNQQYANRCRLKLGALSPDGPSQAYQYFALTAQQILAAQVPAVAMTNGPIESANVSVNSVTGDVTCIVASTTPAGTTLGAQITPGCSNLAISGATNATPIVITTASAHGLLSGYAATIDGVLGNTAANGGWTITVLSAATFSLNGSVGSGAYTGGGTVDGGDLGQVDALLQAKVVPDGTVSQTVSALAFPITVVATVVVPQAYLTTYQAAAPAAIQALLKSYPIGGNIPPGGSAGTVPYSAIEGALVDAGVIVVGAASYVRQVTSLTVNGGTVDLTFPSPEHRATLAPPTINVVGV